VDVRKLGLDILRDLYGSSRRLSMYPLGHPVTQETMKKPLESLNRFFEFKHSFVIELTQNGLMAEGIFLEDTIYVSGLALDMRKHKLSNVIFYSRINIGELYHMLLLLSSKPGPDDDSANRVLKANNIDSIRVNIENPMRMFDFDQPGLSGDTGQFSLSRRITNLTARNPAMIAAYYMAKLKDDDDLLEWINLDFRLNYISRYFKDAFLALEAEKGRKLLEETVFSTNWLDDDLDPQMLAGFKSLFSDYLTRHKEEGLLSDIYGFFKKVGAPESVIEKVFSKSSILQLKTFQESEHIVNTLKYADPSQVDPAVLKKTVFKLAAAGQKSYLTDLLNQLISSISSPTNELRQKGFHLVATAGEVLSKGGFREYFNFLCRESVRLALLPSDTPEPVELAAELSWQALKEGFWQELNFIIKTLHGIKKDLSHSEGKRALAAGKLTEIGESSMLADTFSSLLEESSSEDTGIFFEAFSSLGATSVIRTLARKITHPDINMRSRAIKLLVNMKRDSADILTQILGEQMEHCDGGKLDEEQWYFFRNILRVIKEVKAGEAMPFLEIMSGWNDPRLRLELIKTLEDMPVGGSGKLLEKLSSDDNREIRKAAVVAMGLTGHPDMIPRLFNIFMREPECRVNAIAAMGRIGGPQARDRLIDIFEDDSYFVEFDIPKKDTEQIKVAILKALSRIGDETSLKKLDEYSRKKFDKSLFKKDLLSNTAKVILNSKSS
jgi:HEAT repeat protein